MNDFQILRYLKKYWSVIAIGSLLAGMVFYVIARQNIQEYTAATVIEYTNPEAEKGLAPDGTKIDPTEIYGSNIIIQTMDEMGLNPTDFSIDEFRSGIQVTPFAVEEERKSENDDMTEQDVGTTMYLVTFSADISYGKEFPRKVLNQILECYFAYYGKKHINSEKAANSIQDIYTKGYDYIEMTEVVDSALRETLDLLQEKSGTDGTFRSMETGYSFADLYDEFLFIRRTELSQLTADILLHKITKDREVLLVKYENRRNVLEAANNACSFQSARIRGILSSYESAMDRFDHNPMDPEATSEKEELVGSLILPEVYDGLERRDEEENDEKASGQIAEYDKLLSEYSESITSFEYNNIESAYNQYIINVFSDAPAVSVEKQQIEVMERFQKLTKKTDALYQILDKTLAEYEDYLGAQNLLLLASVGVSEKIPLGVFTAMAVVVFGFFGCMGAVILGRLEDIIEYYAFTNKADGLPNKTKCERFIASLDKKVLSSEFAGIVLKVAELEEENILMNREISERTMKDFAEILTSVFVPSKKVFVGYYGSGQYLIFADGIDRGHVDAALEQFGTVIRREWQQEDSIDYQTGVACAEEEKCYYIRQLLSIALHRLNTDEAQISEPESGVQDIAVES